MSLPVDDSSDFKNARPAPPCDTHCCATSRPNQLCQKEIKNGIKHSSERSGKMKNEVVREENDELDFTKGVFDSLFFDSWSHPKSCD